MQAPVQAATSLISHAGVAAREQTRAAAAGVQKISTGWAGAFTLLTLYITYTRFQAVVPGGGPLWHSLWGFRDISRDYVDVFLCLGITFVVMVIWEKALAAVRWLALAVVVFAAAGVARSKASMHMLGGVGISDAEVALGAGLAAVAALLGLDLWLRVETGRAAPVAHRRRVSWPHAAASGLARWLVLWCVISAATVVYNGVRLYAGMPAGTQSYYLNWRVTSVFLWWCFTLVGPGYCVLTVRLRSCFREDRGDPALTLIMLARRSGRRGPREGLRLLGRRSVRVALLDLMVKFFWAPLMVSFLFSNCGRLRAGLDGAMLVFGPQGLGAGMARLGHAFVSGDDAPFLESTYHAVYYGLFVVDVGLGLLGYLTSSRWLGTKSKSVETTTFGWAMALACYPPFNHVTAQIIPFDASHGVPYSFFDHLIIRHVMMLATLLLFFIYVWATVAFGLRFSNLTHRGVIDTGPYRYIRHPAYITKNLAWWTENMLQFANPWQFVYMLGWNWIYMMRAFTEEKHLLRFDDYRRYCERVRWRFIPGVF